MYPLIAVPLKKSGQKWLKVD